MTKKSPSTSHEEYFFPEVYVEGLAPANEYVVEIDGDYFLSKTYSVPGAKRFFGHIIYEDILNYIDLTEPRIRRSFILIKKYGPQIMSGILVEENTKPCLMEVRGRQPIILISEGDEVSERDKIAYTITNKGEVRTFRSPCTGLLVLNINIPWERPEKYILVVVSKNECREITIRKST